MVQRFLNIASTAVLQPALLCMQLADSAGNIAANALIQTNTIHANTYVTLFEMVTCPLLLQISCCSLPKGISYRMQNPKNPRVFHAVVGFLPTALELL
jgi:hypothetical protein